MGGGYLRNVGALGEGGDRDELSDRAGDMGECHPVGDALRTLGLRQLLLNSTPLRVASE